MIEFSLSSCSEFVKLCINAYNWIVLRRQVKKITVRSIKICWIYLRLNMTIFCFSILIVFPTIISNRFNKWKIIDCQNGRSWQVISVQRFKRWMSKIKEEHIFKYILIFKSLLYFLKVTYLIIQCTIFYK